jgi:hypothetical protein
MAMLPLEVDGDRLGTLMLGPRLDRRPYDRQDFHSLQGVARQVARAMRLAGRPEQLLDAWRLQQDASLSDNK